MKSGLNLEKKHITLLNIRKIDFELTFCHSGAILFFAPAIKQKWVIFKNNVETVLFTYRSSSKQYELLPILNIRLSF